LFDKLQKGEPSDVAFFVAESFEEDLYLKLFKK
jgi:hypothetical protein